MSVNGMSDYHIPADVPDDLADTYLENLMAATCGTGSMNLFACDQKIEHLNDDFYDGGNTIPLSSNDPGISSKLERKPIVKERLVFLQHKVDSSLCMVVIILMFHIWSNSIQSRILSRPSNEIQSVSPCGTWTM